MSLREACDGSEVTIRVTSKGVTGRDRVDWVLALVRDERHNSALLLSPICVELAPWLPFCLSG